MINKERLVFDPAESDETDNVGAYLRASDGTLLTHTDVSGKKALDVNVANEVDIRALTQADEVTVFQGTDPWVVSATDLDIRDLNHAQDNVSIAQGGNTMLVNPDGSINVNADIDIVTGAEKEEDSAHTSGAVGQFILAVRQDTLASSVSADGDYAAFKLNDKGALWVKHDGVIETAQSFTNWLVSQNTVDTTAELVVASALSNRRRILIQNVSGNRTVYLSHANTVSNTNSIRLGAGSSVELELAAGVSIWAIANGTGADLRIAEFAIV